MRESQRPLRQYRLLCCPRAGRSPWPSCSGCKPSSTASMAGTASFTSAKKCAIMVISLLSCLNANQLFCSRTLYAMSCDGLFFRTFTRVNAGGTPALSLLLSTIVGILFVLVSMLKLAGLSPFDLVVDMLSFFFVANYTLSYWSLFALRKKEPQMERPYRAWGYPWTTGIALLASALFLIASIVPDLKTALTTGQVWPPSPAMLALFILLLSYPMFRLLRWVTRRNESRV